MKTKKSNVINLGCRLNFFESDVIRNILEKNNIKDKIVINTCAVTNQALKKSINEVKKASRKYPNHKILVTGCASQIEEKKFEGLKNVEKIIDNKSKTQIYNYVKKKEEKEDQFDFPFLEKFSSKRSRAMLQIQQGCDHRCTFCVIPYGRGDAKSLPFDEILRRTEILIKKGFNEFVLTGVDLTSYGNDLIGEPKLGNILKRLLNNQHELKRIRLSSIDPAEIDKDLFELLVNENRVLPHIHFSLQSGDNMILKRMKRRHSREDMLSLCKELKSQRKELTFGADVIVGFPTETEEHFLNTVNLIKSCEFSNVHIFPYSSRNGTPASRMPQLDPKTVKKRAEILRSESKKLLKKKMQEKVGSITEILYESNKMSYSNDYYKVELKEETNSKLTPGSIIKVKVISYNDDVLIAETIT